MGQRYLDVLIEACQEAKKAVPTREFKDARLEDLGDVKNAIYIIQQIDGDKTKTYESFIEYKALKQRACAKINHPSEVLYVGSSTTGVKKRLEQHLGLGPAGTYALQLNHWFVGRYTMTVREYECSRFVLQLIEDDLSAQLRPAFGKTGGNSK